jgi:hypothetical protein
VTVELGKVVVAAHSDVRDVLRPARHQRWRLPALIRDYWPELSVVALGLGVRVALLKTHAPELGYDFVEHNAPIVWWSEHFSMPPLSLSRGAYHPQLYYALCGLLKRAGASWHGVQALSILLGCLRLLVVFVAARRYLPDRLSRVLTLVLAGFLPASVQLDGMVTQEALNNLVAAGFVVALLEFCRARLEQRAMRALALGALVGLGLLVKVSNFVLLGVLCFAPLLELFQRRVATLRDAAAIVRGWALAVAVAVALSGGQYAYNQVVNGKAIVDGWYKRPTADVIATGAQQKATLDRRTLGFVAGFSTDIVTFPYYPSALGAEPRFWSVLIASTFCDYYRYGFAGPKEPNTDLFANRGAVSARATVLARASVIAGIVIALVCGLASVFAAVRLLRRREVARLLVLAIPAFGLAGQAYFAVVYPFDFEGVVKGVYYQFAALPLCAVFGLAVSSAWRQPRLAVPALLCTLAVVPVAVYTTYCAIWA